MKLLGLRIEDHDASFCLYDNGTIKYAKSERFHQVKHHAYIVQYGWIKDFEKIFGFSVKELDEIAVVADQLKYNNHPLPDRFWQAKPYQILGVKCPVFHVEHHYAHALSQWMYPATDFQFIFDGVGELYSSPADVDVDVKTDKTNIDSFPYNGIQEFGIDGFRYFGVTWSVFKDYQPLEQNLSEFYMRTSSNITALNSFGVEYENMARFCGLESEHPNDLAGKVMSLQSYGHIDYEYADYILENTDPRVNLSSMLHPNNWVKYKGCELVAGLSRLDFAATKHYILEQLMLRIIREYAQPQDSIFLSGGCALNICWNTTIKKEFPNTLVLPHSADDGLSFGCLKYLLDKNGLDASIENFPYVQQDFSPESPTDETIDYAVDLLCEGKIVGWYQNNGEVGPRALGNRSILVNPMLPDARDRINYKVKNREGFRPFGASILKEHAKDYFDLDFDNPHMLYLGKVLKDVPAITHVDGTCRYQTVGDENILYKKLLTKFYNKTGIPLLLNTSLNRGGKPIAGYEQDAIDIFNETDIDAVIVGDTILHKETYE